MNERYGIFKTDGASEPFGTSGITSTPLKKMNVAPFPTVEEAQDFILENSILSTIILRMY